MDIEAVLAPTKIEDDEEDFAAQAFALAASASDGFSTVNQLKQFLEKHLELEVQQVAIFRQFEGKPYHPNTWKAAQARTSAYELMINRLAEKN